MIRLAYADWKLPDIDVPDLPTRKPPKPRWLLLYEEQTVTLIDTASHVVIGYEDAYTPLVMTVIVQLLTDTLERLGKPCSFRAYGLPPSWLDELKSWLEENEFPALKLPNQPEIPRRLQLMRKRYLEGTASNSPGNSGGMKKDKSMPRTPEIEDIVEGLTEEQAKLFRETIAYGLEIQDRYSAEPVFGPTGTGYLKPGVGMNDLIDLKAEKQGLRNED